MPRDHRSNAGTEVLWLAAEGLPLRNAITLTLGNARHTGVERGAGGLALVGWGGDESVLLLRG